MFTAAFAEQHLAHIWYSTVNPHLRPLEKEFPGKKLKLFNLKHLAFWDVLHVLWTVFQ